MTTTQVMMNRRRSDICAPDLIASGSGAFLRNADVSSSTEAYNTSDDAAAETHNVNPEQRKALDLYTWLNVAICIAFPPMLFGVDFFVAPQGYQGSLRWLFFWIVFLPITHSIPGFIVLICWFLYWKWGDYHHRDNWLLAFSFIAVQAPNVFLMIYWIKITITREAVGRGEALLGSWLVPLGLIPITLPIGLFLGWAAFQIARRLR